MTVRLVLVDDDIHITESVSVALEAEGFQVTSFFDSEAAMIELTRNPPDLAILDIKMPRMTGTEMLKKIRQRSDLPVIFLTSKDDEIDEAVGFELGADDYITKPFSLKLLIARIHALLRRVSGAGGAAKKQAMLTRGALSMNLESYSVKWKGEEVKLTLTEFLLLQELAMRPGHVKARQALMETAYSDNMDIDDRTIDSHIKRIRKKFRKHDTSFDEIETLYGAGYRLKEQHG